jgi:hypothetical protein
MREPSRMGEDGSTGVLKENSLTQHSRGQNPRDASTARGFQLCRNPLSAQHDKGDVVFQTKTPPISHYGLYWTVRTQNHANSGQVMTA